MNALFLECNKHSKPTTLTIGQDRLNSLYSELYGGSPDYKMMMELDGVKQKNFFGLAIVIDKADPNGLKVK